MLGQMLRPDVYVATRPAAMAGTLLEELYRLVSHRIEAVAAGDVLREYLCHLFFQLKEQDDLLCGMEHGCDVFAPLAWPEWKQEQAAREEREQMEREMERRREEDEEQAAIWAERERGKPTAPQCKRLPRTFMKPVGGIERWTEIQTLTDLEDMFYALYEDNFQTVGDLIRHTEHELSQYANLGKSGARRITQTLQTLNMQPGLWPTVWGDSDISDQEAMLEAWREEDEAQWREEYGEWLSDIQKEQNEFAQ